MSKIIINALLYIQDKTIMFSNNFTNKEEYIKRHSYLLNIDIPIVDKNHNVIGYRIFWKNNNT